MEAIGGLVVLLVVIGGLAVLVRALGSQKRRATPKTDPNWQPPISDPLPYYAQSYFFSVAERRFYEALKAAVPPSHTIFAKVRIADLVGIKKGTGAWRTHFNKISCKHADFLLCDSSLSPVLVIELDDSSHDRDDRKERDAFVDEVFAAAMMPILHVRAKAAYAISDLQLLLERHVPAGAAASRHHTGSVDLDERYMGRSAVVVQ